MDFFIVGRIEMLIGKKWKNFWQYTQNLSVQCQEFNYYYKIYSYIQDIKKSGLDFQGSEVPNIMTNP